MALMANQTTKDNCELGGGVWANPSLSNRWRGNCSPFPDERPLLGFEKAFELVEEANAPALAAMRRNIQQAGLAHMDKWYVEPTEDLDASLGAGARLEWEAASLAVIFSTLALKVPPRDVDIIFRVLQASPSMKPYFSNDTSRALRAASFTHMLDAAMHLLRTEGNSAPLADRCWSRSREGDCSNLAYCDWSEEDHQCRLSRNLDRLVAETERRCRMGDIPYLKGLYMMLFEEGYLQPVVPLYSEVAALLDLHWLEQVQRGYCFIVTAGLALMKYFEIDHPELRDWFFAAFGQNDDRLGQVLRSTLIESFELLGDPQLPLTEVMDFLDLRFPQVLRPDSQFFQLLPAPRFRPTEHLATPRRYHSLRSDTN